MRLWTKRRRWRVHICTMTPDQQPFAAAVTRWLLRRGHRVLASESASAAEKIAAARACDVCLLLLGPTYAPREPQASFSITELEAYAALEGNAHKLLIFAQPTAETATSVEQREFVTRLRHFTSGTFQATCATPAEFVTQVQAALKHRQVAVTSLQAATLDIKRSVMISSTGDLIEERARLRRLLTRQRYPVIDYLTASSEPEAPIERVTGWASGCRALVLVLGQRYGYVSPVDGLGVTELEFVTALNAGRPILALLRPEALNTNDPNQRQFVARVRHLLSPENVRLCPTIAELEREARAGLPRILASASASPAAIPTIPAEAARQWYQQQLRRWLDRLPHPRNPDGMPLQTMPLLLSPEHLDVDALLKRTDNRLTYFRPETLSGVVSSTPDDTLASTPRLLLIGPAGAGKSVVLRWYALNAQDDRTPVLVSLPRYARARAYGQVTSLMDYIERDERRMILAAPSDASHWRSALLAGQGLLLLDDWHLLTNDAQTMVAADIQACAAELPPTTPVVIAQRDGPADSWLGFTPMYILPLMQGQIQEIVTQWMAVAHADEHLSDEQLRSHVDKILYPMRVHFDLTNWARTPLMLNALTTILDGMEGNFSGTLLGSAAVLLRRALRLLLAFDSHPRYLWEKERLLLAVARLTLHDPPRDALPSELMDSAWSSIARETSISLETVADELLRQSTLLLPDQARQNWIYTHSIFRDVYAVSVLAALPSAARTEYMARHRLFSAFAQISLLLPSELDRLGCPQEADAVIATLLRGDSDAVAGSGYPDPYHFALHHAALAQGARAREYAVARYGPEIARRLGKLLRDHDHAFTTNDVVIGSLILLGPAAEAAIDDLIAAPESSRNLHIIALREFARDGNAQAQAAVAAFDAEHPRDSLGKRVFQFGARLDEAQAGLKSDDPETRGGAVLAMAKFGPHAAPAVPDLMRALADPDEFVRQQAIYALMAIGTASAPAAPELLRLALRDSDYWVRAVAHDAIADLNLSKTDMLPAIEAQLHAEEPKLRSNAARTAGSFGEDGAPFVPKLIEMVFHDPDDDVAFGAAFSLKRIGAAAIEAANAAAEAALRGNDQEVIDRVLGNLVPALGPDAAPLVDALRVCIRDPAFPKRGTAISAVSFLKSAATPLLPDLRVLLAEPDLSWLTVKAVGEIGPTAAPLLDALLALQDHPEYLIRSSVYTALYDMRVTATPEIVAALLRGMDDSEKLVRRSAYAAARTLRPVIVEIVRELLRRYYTLADSEEVGDLRFALIDCLPECWDVGPLSGVAEASAL